MKRYARMRVCAVLAAFAIVGVVGAADAHYIITLRDGREIKVTRYEDRGDHIVYKRFAGKVTLPKARIATIVNMSTGK